ncbi:hypothetical protein ABGB17_09560 [Sphaerisporangium sp. B11E5]|uniref:hypothetical protein n=1 Tax=Sphaerisporangium sp. B11E5 TaxID=3153563 RepID=UPI00325DC97E
MISRLITRIVMILSLSAALLTMAAPAQAAGPYCIPEAPVCAGLEGSRFVFIIKPPPSWLSVSATVNGAPTSGAMSGFSTGTYFQGWYQPNPPLTSGDRICVTLYAPGVPAGPYCATMP